MNKMYVNNRFLWCRSQDTTKYSDIRKKNNDRCVLYSFTGTCSIRIASLYIKISYGFEISIVYMIFVFRGNQFLFKQLHMLQNMSTFTSNTKYNSFQVMVTCLHELNFQTSLKLLLLSKQPNWNYSQSEFTST